LGGFWGGGWVAGLVHFGHGVCVMIPDLHHQWRGHGRFSAFVSPYRDCVGVLESQHRQNSGIHEPLLQFIAYYRYSRSKQHHLQHHRTRDIDLIVSYAKSIAGSSICRSSNRMSSCWSASRGRLRALPVV
jgi:hypothetical protein